MDRRPQGRLRAASRPPALGASTNTYTDEELASLQGRTFAPEGVAELVLEAVARKQLYIHTRKEAEALFRRRAERIMAAFDYAV